MISRGHSRWWFRLAALAAVVVIAALALLVYSPWHRHDPLATGVCPYCHFHHVPSEAAGGEAMAAPPPVPAVWLAHAAFSSRVGSAALPAALTRGPPSCPSNSQTA